ncbi:MAG: 3-phosphoshikimate 1-carboxyvinyltransferase [Sporolactobacillus sp.]|jgi:3-phosphoshikimate 1-carboxyvinyltransferase|nr:3-phosphoshikimate 1-carboxyvinyltransferase [Sporolactobacillus sp.]
MRKLTTNLPHGLRGELQVPGDKSISHRSIIFGAVADGITDISHFLPSGDCLTTVRAFAAMGVPIKRSGDRVSMHGIGFSGLRRPQQPLDMGNSGTTARLLLGVLSGRPFSTRLFGDASLSRRPMRRVTDPLEQTGARFAVSESGTLPITVHGRPDPSPIRYRLPIASAQLKSALILAALQAAGESTIIEKLPTRDHTEQMLEAFGGKLRRNGTVIRVAGRPMLRGQSVTIPGDLSSAAFFITAAALVPGSDITLHNVGVNPTRTGFLDILKKMGASITVVNRHGRIEPAADLRIRSSMLHAATLTEKDIPASIDELPLVALLATQAEGITTITGAGELRVKETDRIAVVSEELRRLGADIVELPDGMRIRGNAALRAPGDCRVSSHGDHRIGMMLAVAALITRGSLTLAGDNAIAISYPNFFTDLTQLTGDKRGVVQ